VIHGSDGVTHERGDGETHQARTGVCVVRIESQRSGILVTLRTNADVAKLPVERVIVVADVEAAVEAVRSFLVAFAATSRNDEIG
jgi:hypothetical protein